jgi:drug/metabolite transporter (DMT)-like permease
VPSRNGASDEDGPVVAYVLALLAAVAFAFGSVLQQKGTLETEAGEGDARFLVQVLRRPVWVAGGLSQVSGWILQAVALGRGSLIVVQSLTTLSLVFALPLGRRLTGQIITRRTWLGAGAVVLGIVLFLSVGEPVGGISHPGVSAWWAAIAVALVGISSLAVLARQRRGAARALYFGCAAGICFAVQASVTKVFVTIVGGGIVALLTSWTVYVLVLSALVGFALQQSALKTGSLAPAIASSNAVTLFMSVVLGVTIFQEKLWTGDDRAVASLAGLALGLFGVGTLASSDAATDHGAG